MEELKKIVAVFIKKDPAVINNDTLINSVAIPGSILIHRMYAAINSAGFTIKEYYDINTFGELLARLNVSKGNEHEAAIQQPVNIENNLKTIANAIGIDMEAISNFPPANDYREHEFYKLNFSMNEISYCILKKEPLTSFAGLFSAKEALCKANNELKKKPFSQLEITHDDKGMPLFPGFSLSISHNEQFAIAVAVAGNVSQRGRAESGYEKIQSVVSDDSNLSSLKRKVSLLFVTSGILALLLLYMLFR